MSLFNRDGWTFHAKGLWISVGEKNTAQQIVSKHSLAKINNPQSLRVVIGGSGKFSFKCKLLVRP